MRHDETMFRDIMGDVLEERRDQHEKWGQQDHNYFFWQAILVEEVGEVAKALLSAATSPIMPDENLEEELLQVAAVAVAWIEGIRRQRQMVRKDQAQAIGPALHGTGHPDNA
jgi:NTP pyrophosphatase (non-canonical NTP hydrolase)